MSHHPTETILNVIPGSAPDERLLIVLRSDGGPNICELRQQSWGEGVGWYTQSNIQIGLDQVGPLRQALGTSACLSAQQQPAPRPSSPFVPRVVWADSA